VIRLGRIASIGAAQPVMQGTEVIEANGGVLLPGLHDHHLHLASLAVSRESLACGPEACADGPALARALKRQAQTRPGAWIRGIGYHESVAGNIDAAWLDRQLPDTPVRIQHRGGRLWVFNSAAMERLEIAAADPLEKVDGQHTGRLYEGDAWLRKRMSSLRESRRPELAAVSRMLAGFGITALTDTTPQNGLEDLQWFQAEKEQGALLQDIRLMGNASLDGVRSMLPGVTVGEHKFHLLESDLPDLDAVAESIRQSHAVSRNVAFHCVTRAELVFALAAIREAGSRPGDRIEHASVTPPELMQDIATLGLTVVTQPVFVQQRGDQYLQDVAAEDQPWLYRLQGFLEAGVALAGSSDAPFGDSNPWKAMQAAVERSTASGQALGVEEALGPEQALALYTGPLSAPGQPVTALVEGMSADLCLLGCGWAEARRKLATVEVQLTLMRGQVVFP